MTGILRDCTMGRTAFTGMEESLKGSLDVFVHLSFLFLFLTPEFLNVVQTYTCLSGNPYSGDIQLKAEDKNILYL